ncbi:MAG TPA: MerR family transcriptional regulator [Armatimonadota bacterium]|nr:MerR family transcriptional regulator [Armatimonadota bacterium]
MTEKSEAEEPVYVISVAARLLEVHPQTLRLYERLGLMEPARNQRNIRLYSDSDVERVRRIQHLTQDMGVNLAGVEIILDLLDRLEREREQADHRIGDIRRKFREYVARLREETKAEVRRQSRGELALPEATRVRTRAAGTTRSRG